MQATRDLKVRFSGVVDLAVAKAQFRQNLQEMQQAASKISVPVIKAPRDRAGGQSDAIRQQQGQAQTLAQQARERARAEKQQAREQAKALREQQKAQEQLFKTRVALSKQKVAEDLKAQAQAAKELQQGLQQVAIAGAATFGALALGAKVSLDEFARYESSVGAIEHQLGKTTNTIATTAGEIDRFADAMGDATLGNEQAIRESAQQLLALRGIGRDAFFDILTLSQDMGVSAEQLGRRLQDPVRAMTQLERQGLLLNDQQREQIRAMEAVGDRAGAQAVIINQLKDQYGGAAVAAAQGLAGSLDTLGEEIQDSQRIIGEQLAPTVNGLVGLLTGVVDAFNNLPAPIQQALIATTAFGGALAAVITAIATYEALQVKSKIATLGSAAAKLKDLTVTQGATVAQAAYAAAIGKATVAQKQQIGAFLAGSAKAGLFAAAIASIALAYNSFQKITAEAAKTRDSIGNINDAFSDLAEAQANAGRAAQEGAGGLSVEAQALKRTEESLGAVERAVDTVREVVNRFSLRGLLEQFAQLDALPEPLSNLLNSVASGMAKLNTASETSLNRQQVAFGDLIAQAEGAEHAFNNIKLGAGFDNASQEELNAIAALLAETERALEGTSVATTADAGVKKVYLQRIRELRKEHEALTHEQQKQVISVENLTNAYQKELDEIALAEARSQAQVAESIANGANQEQAQQQALAKDKEFIQQRLTQARELQTELQQALQGSEGEDRDKAEQAILKNDTEIAKLRKALADKDIEATKAAEDAKTKAIEDAEKKRQEAREQALKVIEDAETERLIILQKDLNAGLISEEDFHAQAAQFSLERAEAEIEHAENKSQAVLSALQKEGEAQEALKAIALKRIEEETDAEVRSQQERERAIQRELALQDTLSRSFQRRGELLDAELSLLKTINDTQQSAFQIAAGYTENEQQRQRLEREAADARVAGLIKSQDLELKIFELKEKQKASDLEKEKIQNRIQQSQLRVQLIEARGEARSAEESGDNRALLDAQAKIAALIDQGSQLQQLSAEIEQSIVNQQQQVRTRRLEFDRQQEDNLLKAQDEQARAGGGDPALQRQVRDRALEIARSRAPATTSSQPQSIANQLANNNAVVDIPGINASAIAQQLQAQQKAQAESVRQMAQIYTTQQKAQAETLRQSLQVAQRQQAQAIRERLQLQQSAIAKQIEAGSAIVNLPAQSAEIPSQIVPRVPSFEPISRPANQASGGVDKDVLVGAIREAFKEVNLQQDVTIEQVSNFAVGANGKREQSIAEQVSKQNEELLGNVIDALKQKG